MTDHLEEHDPMAEEVKGKKKSDEELQLLALEKFMSTKDGRGFLWLYLTQCGIFSSDFNHDPTMMAHLTGRRDSGRILEAEMKKASMRFYLLMIEENEDGG